MAYFLFFVGALIPSYLVLLFCNFGWRRIARRRNSPLSIVAIDVVTLAIVTIAAGYGMKDGRPEPVFEEALASYFLPVAVAVVILLIEWAVWGQRKTALDYRIFLEPNGDAGAAFTRSQHTIRCRSRRAKPKKFEGARTQ